MKRQRFLRRLRDLLPEYGSENVVYFDETGFEQTTHREHGWALRGQKIYANVVGKYQTRTNLIMAQRGQEWLAPMLFEGACTMNTVKAWIEHALLKELKRPSIVIMDNAPVHNKTWITKTLEQHGHVALFLPPYSPDFNPIEKTFGGMKRKRQFIKDQSVENLVRPIVN